MFYKLAKRFFEKHPVIAQFFFFVWGLEKYKTLGITSPAEVHREGMALLIVVAVLMLCIVFVGLYGLTSGFGFVLLTTYVLGLLFVGSSNEAISFVLSAIVMGMLAVALGAVLLAIA